jgi:large subunit ribosomal protein L1
LGFWQLFGCGAFASGVTRYLRIQLSPVFPGIEMSKPSKRYRALAEKVSEEPVSLSEAVKLVKSFGTTKFDQTVEIHMNLGIDPKQADQIVRGSLVLPNGIGKTQRILVFAKDAAAKAAEEAGADFVGQEDLASKVSDGWLDFDVCIASPDMMGVVGRLGRVLGPRNLMPSPRAGTVTPDVATAVKEYKAGKVEFRNDNGGNVHAVVGRLSFDEAKLEENVSAFLAYVDSLKPISTKGTYVKSISISAAMSPGVWVAA